MKKLLPLVLAFSFSSPTVAQDEEKLMRDLIPNLNGASWMPYSGYVKTPDTFDISYTGNIYFLKGENELRTIYPVCKLKKYGSEYYQTFFDHLYAIKNENVLYLDVNNDGLEDNSGKGVKYSSEVLRNSLINFCELNN